MSNLNDAGNKMTYTALLNKFVDETREHFSEPFLIGDYACATNSWVMLFTNNINVGITKTIDQKRTNGISEMLASNEHLGLRLEVGEVNKAIELCPKVEEMEVLRKGESCGACDGTGTREETFEYKRNDYTLEGDCPVCDGDGQEVKAKTRATGNMVCDPDQEVAIDGARFKYKWFIEMYKISELLKESIILESHTPNRFFRIGDINLLVMPCHNSGKRVVYNINTGHYGK